MDNIEITRKVLNLTLSDAEPIFNQEKLSFRVVQSDGESFAVSFDYNEHRANLVLENDKIVKVNFG